MYSYAPLLTIIFMSDFWICCSESGTSFFSQLLGSLGSQSMLGFSKESGHLREGPHRGIWVQSEGRRQEVWSSSAVPDLTMPRAPCLSRTGSRDAPCGRHAPWRQIGLKEAPGSPDPPGDLGDARGSRGLSCSWIAEQPNLSDV